jgi:hypothetical protein
MSYQWMVSDVSKNIADHLILSDTLALSDLSLRDAVRPERQLSEQPVRGTVNNSHS